jgi:hypothetical protein
MVNENVKEARTEVNGLAVNDDEEEFGELAWDDVNLGEQLDIEKVKKARDEEVRFLIKEGIYVKCDYDECLQKTGKYPASVRWIKQTFGAVWWHATSRRKAV